MYIFFQVQTSNIYLYIEQCMYFIFFHKLYYIFIYRRIYLNRLNMDPSWSETGDRYMLKLFRDHIFHQVTEDGRPFLDMAHIIHCLNKLDAGTHEKVKLLFLGR